MKLPSFIHFARPAIPRIKASVPVVLALLACIGLIWVWIYGPEWKLKDYQPFEPLLSRWLVTALVVLLAVCWLTFKMVRRLQQLEKLQLQANAGRRSDSWPISNSRTSIWASGSSSCNGG